MDCSFTPSDAFVVGSSGAPSAACTPPCSPAESCLGCRGSPAAEDGRVLYWELVEAELVHSFQAHDDVVCSLAVHPKGDCLLTSSVDGTIKVWA